MQAFVSVTKNVTLPSLTTGTRGTVVVDVTGIDGDVNTSAQVAAVVVNHDDAAQVQGYQVYAAAVTALNQVTLYCQNTAAGTLTPTNGPITITLLRQ